MLRAQEESSLNAPSGPPASTRTITDATGHVCYDADFTPYGQEINHTNSCPQNYKFTSDERDSETSLDHTLFRQYTSQLARWLFPNPLGGSIVNPQSLNRYGGWPQFRRGLGFAFTRGALCSSRTGERGVPRFCS